MTSETDCEEGILNNRRLLVAIGNIPPAVAETSFYAALEVEPMAA
jgi:hypothetical protein